MVWFKCIYECFEGAGWSTVPIAGFRFFIKGFPNAYI